MLELEAGALWLARNDVQIPNETGTRFSLQELIGAGPSELARAELTWNINPRHALRVVYAPVRVERSGTPAVNQGGADVDQVFNFAWLNAVVASLAVRF